MRDSVDCLSISYKINILFGGRWNDRKGASVEDRILIVDDEEVICSILARRLTREGYSCVTAHNGKEGLNHFYKDSFSLIISDIKMPEMDGIELLKKVRAVHRASQHARDHRDCLS
jgi:CheY-like chemotaxis protein